MRLLPLLLLSACATVTPDARYVGTMTPTTVSPLCRPDTATLRLRDGQALFTPNEATWSLPGTATATGDLLAERTGIGADRRPFPTRLTGRWTNEAATGTYATPRCVYAVALTRN